jgi:threonine dehydrogenase-like Zn-dependent dehydrogenase
VVKETPEAANVLLLGGCLENVDINPTALLVRETAFQASYGCDMEEFRRCIEMVRGGRVDVERVISGTVSIDEVPEAFERLCEPNDEVKLVMEIP